MSQEVSLCYGPQTDNDILRSGIGDVKVSTYTEDLFNSHETLCQTPRGQ